MTTPKPFFPKRPIESCDHLKWVHVPAGVDADGEPYEASSTQEPTYADIDLGRYYCTQCGRVSYYTSHWKDYYEKGIPCPGSENVPRAYPTHLLELALVNPVLDHAPVKASDVDVVVFQTNPEHQWVHKPAVGVRLLHKPTGIEVTSTTEHSLHGNRHRAWKLLMAAILLQQGEPTQWPESASSPGSTGHAEPSEQTAEPTFEQVTEPLMQWLAHNHHAHTVVLVDATSATLLEGLVSHAKPLQG